MTSDALRSAAAQTMKAVTGWETRMHFLKKLEPFTLFLLRCGLALVLMYHGYPKLFGSTQQFIESFQAIGLPAYVVRRRRR